MTEKSVIISVEISIAVDEEPRPQCGRCDNDNMLVTASQKQANVYSIALETEHEIEHEKSLPTSLKSHIQPWCLAKAV